MAKAIYRKKCNVLNKHKITSPCFQVLENYQWPGSNESDNTAKKKTVN